MNCGLKIVMFLSPVIKAASEKLSALSGVEPKKPALSKKQSSGSGIVSGLPSASDEVLEAQKKRFEELKVHCTCATYRCTCKCRIVVVWYM